MNSETADMQPKIKVLLVDDSLIALTLLRKMLSSAPDIEVAGTAKNGREALELIARLNPAVVCTDLHMPVMDGLDLTREIMDRHPRPILVISASVSDGNHNVFQLMDAGAVDVFPKPRGGLEAEYIRQADDLINRIRILAGVLVFRKKKKEAAQACVVPVEMRFQAKQTLSRIVAIGASTGGPQALQHILSRLPADFPLPVVCVQHIGAGFLKGLAEWLQSICAINIEIASEGAAPMPGTVYFPREEAHLLIDGGGRFKYSMDMLFNGHRPSINVTFQSIAERYGSGAIGVLLTGMGNDGAEGLKAMADAGGVTIAQDEKTSVVFGMPKRAIELGAAGKVLPLEGIAPMILAAISSQPSAISFQQSAYWPLIADS